MKRQFAKNRDIASQLYEGTDQAAFSDNISAQLNRLDRNTDVDKLLSESFAKNFQTSKKNQQKTSQVVDVEGAKLRRQI